MPGLLRVNVALRFSLVDKFLEDKERQIMHVRQVANWREALFHRHVRHATLEETIVQAWRPRRLGVVSTHDGKLRFELVDVLLRRVGVDLGEVPVQYIPLVPLEPSAGLEHAQQVMQKGLRVVAFDDTDEVTYVDNVVLLNQVIRHVGEDVCETKRHILRQPCVRRTLVEADVNAV